MWSVQREAQALALAAASRGAGMTHLGSRIHSALGTPPDRLHREKMALGALGEGRSLPGPFLVPTLH